MTSMQHIPCYVTLLDNECSFSDMRAERNWLAREAYPKLKSFCYNELDLDFHVLDMRWGITDDATNEHITEQLCLNEIASCQRLSLGPNFVVCSLLYYSMGNLKKITSQSTLLDNFEKLNKDLYSHIKVQGSFLTEWDLRWKSYCKIGNERYLLMPSHVLVLIKKVHRHGYNNSPPQMYISTSDEQFFIIASQSFMAE